MTAYAIPREDADSLRAAIALCLGGVILLLRAQALALGTARSVAVVALDLGLAALSLRTAAPDAGAARIRLVPVTLAGIGAVIAVTYAPWQIGATVAYGAGALVMGAVAAVAEEAFFRRLMYAWLERWWGPALAVLVSALAFALVHVPLYGASVLWVDLGAGVLLSWQRWATGSWAAPAATHVVANALAVAR